jgi:hypothetical protein
LRFDNLDLFEDVADDRRDRRESGTKLLVRYVKDCLLGVLKDFLGGILVLVAPGHHLVRDLDQAAQGRFLSDNLGVKLYVNGPRQAVGKARQVSGASYSIEFACTLEFFFQRDQVDGPRAGHQPEHLVENPSMTFQVEVLGLQVFKHRQDGPVIEEDCSQYGSLRFEVVRKRLFQADIGHEDLRLTIDD